jgi:Replication-relaxation
LLEKLNEYHFLTVKQGMQVLHSSSENYTRERFAALEAQTYFRRGFLSRTTQFGTAPSVYTLAKNGKKYLVDREITVRKYYSPSEFASLTEPGDDWLTHAVTITDVLLSAALLEEHAADYPLLEFRNEHVLEYTPVSIDAGEKGKKTKVLLDAWLKFQLPTRNEQGFHHTLPFGLEVDRGSHDVTSFKQRFRARVHFINGPYQKAFHTKTVTIGYAVRCNTEEKSKRRAALLRTWAEEVLTEENKKDDALFFLFTPLPKSRIDPVILWLSPVWAAPFDTSAHIAVDVHA